LSEWLSDKATSSSTCCAFDIESRFWGEPFRPRGTRSGRLSRSHEVSQNGRCAIRTTGLVCPTATRQSDRVAHPSWSAPPEVRSIDPLVPGRPAFDLARDSLVTASKTPLTGIARLSLDRPWVFDRNVSGPQPRGERRNRRGPRHGRMCGN
jgi:hypothetical protein